MGPFRTFYLKDRMPGKTLFNGIKLGVYSLAVTSDKVEQAGLIQTKLGKYSIYLKHTASESVRSFHTESYQSNAIKDSPLFKDRATGSILNLQRGSCIAGKLKGTQLKEVVVNVAYWFAWSAFYPNTLVMD